MIRTYRTDACAAGLCMCARRRRKPDRAPSVRPPSSNDYAYGAAKPMAPWEWMPVAVIVLGLAALVALGVVDLVHRVR